MVQVRAVHGVEVKGPARINEGPERLGPAVHLVVPPLFVRIVEECAEETGVQMVQHRREKILIELEGVRKLLSHLGGGKRSKLLSSQIKPQQFIQFKKVKHVENNTGT